MNIYSLHKSAQAEQLSWWTNLSERRLKKNE